MNVFGVGLPEMALILVLALLVFGPKKLPEIGQSLAKTIKSFQNASREFEEELKREAQQIEKAVTTPMKATLEDDPQKVLAAPATGDTTVDEAVDAPEAVNSGAADDAANSTGDSELAEAPADTDTPA